MKKHLARILLLVMCIMLFAGVKPTEASAAGNEADYRITSKVSDVYNAGTNSAKVHFTFYGTEGSLYLNNMGKRIEGNAFKRNATNTYTINDTTDIGQIYGLDVHCGTDGVRFDYIKIEVNIGGNWKQLAYFTINDWIDNTNKVYYANRENIYRIKVLTADNIFDGTGDTITMAFSDSAGNSFTVPQFISTFQVAYGLQSGTEDSFTMLASTKLNDVRYVTLTNTSGSATPDEWRPAYIQVERMSAKTTAGDIKWESEVLFIPNASVGVTPLTVERYGGTVTSDKASGLASIFFDPSFYVIISIVALMSTAGVVVYVKKKTAEKEKVR